ncbi:MAG: hypothetical protein WCJ40_02220 [Planctomycetota bacterium]
MKLRLFIAALILSGLAVRSYAEQSPLGLSWKENLLTISGDQIPGGKITVWYIEAYCRAGSTARNWQDTVFPHTTKVLEASKDQTRIVLESKLEDGVVVRHTILSTKDSVNFELEAFNPTNRQSDAHWGQPCMRVDRFVGMKPEYASEGYLSKSFLFVENPETKQPQQVFLNKLQPWSKLAKYTPGQVWAGPGVSRNDLNPRPLSPIKTANGLIGCVSSDGKKILATAWEPYQELFQGVIVCLHSDFRIGGLAPGEKRLLKGRIYVVENNLELLLNRYQKDFPAR